MNIKNGIDILLVVLPGIATGVILAAITVYTVCR